MTNIEGVVAVQNHGTSGSTLMQSLLDFHPRILSLPCLHGHTIYLFWETHGHLPAHQLLKQFLETYAYWGNPSLVPDTLGLQEMGENRDQPTKIDMRAYEEALKDLGWIADSPLSRRNYITTIYIAYAQVLGRILDQSSYWIVFPIHGHTVERAQYLIEDFNKTFFLHTTRHPIQNMGSGAKHIMKEPAYGDVYLLMANTRQIFLEHAIHVGTKDLRGVHYYAPDSTDGRIQSKAIRLEDMHKDSLATMSAVAQWLQIEWDPLLLRSTYDGKLWNNRPTSIRQSGLGGDTIKQIHSEIFNRFDRWRILQVGQHLFSFYHYTDRKDLAPAWVRCFLLPPLLLLPFKVEYTNHFYTLAYPTICRKYGMQSGNSQLNRAAQKLFPSIHRKITTNCYTNYAFRIACNITEWLNGLPKYAASIITLFLWIAGIVKARTSLLQVWAQSFRPIEANSFVPLLHYKE